MPEPGLDLDVLPAQAEVLCDTTSDNILFVGGMGASKTWTMVLKSILLSGANHPFPVQVYEPTFPMVRKILLPTYEEVFDRYGFPWRYHKSEHTVQFAHDGVWSRIHLDSGEEPDRLVGPTLAAVLIDEAGKQKQGVWDKLPTRVRHPGARVLQFCAFGTPEDFGPFYQWCEGEWDESTRGTRRVVRADTRSNIYLPPTPDEYVRRRFGQLGPEDFERYVCGRFVPLGQRVYPFDRRAHAAATTEDPFRGDILVGCDFNFGKMVWIIGSRRGDHLHVFAELVRRQTTTWDQAAALVALLRREMDRWRGRDPMYGSTAEEACMGVTAYVDPSARNRSVRAYDSDVEQMRRAGLRRVYHEGAAIPIRDRVSSVAWRLRIGAMTVDTAACPELTKALEMQGYDSNGEPKKGEGEADLSGAADALGYMVYGIPPWRASMPQGNSVTYSAYV